MIEDLKRVREALQHIVDGQKPGGVTNITVAPKALTLLDNLIADIDSGSMVCMEVKPNSITFIPEPNLLAFLDTPETLEAMSRTASHWYNNKYQNSPKWDELTDYQKDCYRIQMKDVAAEIKRLAVQSNEGGE